MSKVGNYGLIILPWPQKLITDHKTMVSLKYRGWNSKTNGANNVPNGLYMAQLCEKEENRPNGAYKLVGTMWQVSSSLFTTDWRGGTQNYSTDFSHFD